MQKLELDADLEQNPTPAKLAKAAVQTAEKLNEIISGYQKAEAKDAAQGTGQVPQA